MIDERLLVAQMNIRSLDSALKMLQKQMNDLLIEMQTLKAQNAKITTETSIMNQKVMVLDAMSRGRGSSV